MELRQLHYFIVVAEEGGFRRAAARLYMAQPPLSQQIAALERELGLQLFSRTARGSQLTEAAQALLPYARRAVAAADATVSASRSLRDGTEGSLRLGFVGSAALHLVPRILSYFGRRWPLVRFDLHELPNGQQVERLQNGRLDAGIVRCRKPYSEVESKWLVDEELVVATPASHPFARVAGSFLADFRNESFIGIDRQQSPQLFEELSDMCEIAGFRYEPQRWCKEYATALGLVSAGLGVAIVPRALEVLRLPGLAYISLLDDYARSPIYLVRMREGTSMPATLLFDSAEVLRDELDAEPGPPSSGAEP
jgi:DNA-binding transcriptional LysR family regulator